MTSLLRKLQWWLQRGRREADLREELRFHLDEEASERQAEGLSHTEAAWVAQRDLGNAALLTEDARTLWSWTLLEQLAQDVRYGLRSMAKNRLFTALAALSLALGIGANTAIYSFMDALLFRSLPVPQPESLVAVTWRARPYSRDLPRAAGSQFVLHSIDGSTYRDASGITASIMPLAAFERLRDASSSVFSAVFAYRSAGRLNVIVRGEADIATGEYVTGDVTREFLARIEHERSDGTRAQRLLDLPGGRTARAI